MSCATFTSACVVDDNVAVERVHESQPRRSWRMVVQLDRARRYDTRQRLDEVRRVDCATERRCEVVQIAMFIECCG